MIRSTMLWSVLALAGLVVPALAQYPPGQQGSSNMKVVAHIPTGGSFYANEIEIEQELSRPYAYVSRRSSFGFYVIDLKDPAKARVIHDWEIENAAVHQGRALNPEYFKLRGRYYLVLAFWFQATGPDHELGAAVFDVTGLPEGSTVREVGRIRTPDTPGGFHNIYMYKHSDGRALLFATAWSAPGIDHGANVYDMEKFLSGAPDQGLVGRIPLPEPRGAVGGYHDIYVGYDPASGQDRFYGGGPEVTLEGGFYVYDVSDIARPALLASVMKFPGQSGAHTFVPTPDGRYVLTRSQGGHQPIRVFDLKPALDGQVKNVSRVIGAWTANWKNGPHNLEVRWPYVFASTYEDGVHVLNLMDPTNPYTVGYYDTYDGPDGQGSGGPGTHSNGSYGIDVRNADGLIVTADMTTGFWALKLDGFDGWNGHQWGVPNVSSEQDWDNGPEGAPKPTRVTTR